MSATERLLANNRRYAESAHVAGLAASPSLQVAVVACMDARLDVYDLLGLKLGEAHVIRNAGGVVTDDVLRSLLISQRLLGTREIMLIHHTDCGMLTFSDDDVKRDVYRETGVRPSFALEAFDDAFRDVRQSIARIEACPFLRHKDAIRGFVFDVKSGRLEKVDHRNEAVSE